MSCKKLLSFKQKFIITSECWHFVLTMSTRIIQLIFLDKVDLTGFSQSSRSISDKSQWQLWILLHLFTTVPCSFRSQFRFLLWMKIIKFTPLVPGEWHPPEGGAMEHTVILRYKPTKRPFDNLQEDSCQIH